MANRFRISVLVILAGFLCGCTSPDTEHVARSNGSDSNPDSSNSLAANGENALEANGAEMASPTGRTRSEHFRSETHATSNPPEASDQPETSTLIAADNPPETRDPKGADSEGKSRTEPDTDPPINEPARPETSLPLIPSGKTGTDLGDTFPQVQGKDVEGVKFQLSDYEGKVLMIDFWGDW